MQTTYRYYDGMRVVKVKVFSLLYIFQVLYVLCFTRPRYQVSVLSTIGPLVSINYTVSGPLAARLRLQLYHKETSIIVIHPPIIKLTQRCISENINIMILEKLLCGDYYVLRFNSLIISLCKRPY